MCCVLKIYSCTEEHGKGGGSLVHICTKGIWEWNIDVPLGSKYKIRMKLHNAQFIKDHGQIEISDFLNTQK